MDGKHSFTWKMKSKSSLNLTEHEYYGPLIDVYTKTILKSGLLLDEDLEVLLNISNFTTSPERGYKPSLSLLANICSVLGCSLIAKRYQVPLLVVPSLIMATKSVVAELKIYGRRKNNREIVNKLIEVIKKIQRLNLSIIRYMKTRSELGNAKNPFLTLCNNSVKEFLNFLLKNEYDFIQRIKNVLKTISMYSQDLSDDYTYLASLNIPSILESTDVDNMENCLAVARKMQDLRVLFTSKLLSYIGIVLCSKTSSLHEGDLDTLLNETLCNALKYFQRHHDTVKKQFVTLRQSVNKKSEYKLQAIVKTTGKRQIQTKLKETLMCSVNNLSIILEKSQNMLDAVEKSDEINFNEVGDAILDLKNHTFATYESLDLLCKLYGILANSNSNVHLTENKLKLQVQTKDDLEQNLPVINCDDSAEPLEEKFELYVAEENFSHESSSAKYDCDRTDEYLSLMLRELRQSLRQHQRFIDAKNRRGSDDDEDVMGRKSSVELRKSPPKFDLSVVNESSQLKLMTKTNEVSNLKEQKEIVAPDVPVSPRVPVPPPPPPPVFQLNNLEEETGPVNTRSMLDNIKALSSQRNVEEDVFGYSDAVSNCSNIDDSDDD